VLESVRHTGATVVDFGTVIPPMTWPNQTTPLMTAATQGRNDLVEDLLARGYPHDAADDPAARDANQRTPADLARMAGHHRLASRLDPTPDAPHPPIIGADGAVRFGRGAAGTFLYNVAAVVLVLGLFVPYAIVLANVWSLVILAWVALLVWFQRHLPWAAGPLALRDDTLALLTLRGVVHLPLAQVRGVPATPAHGIHGAPWHLILCQDLVGRQSTPARLRDLEPAFISMADAERFAAVANRHVVIIMGRGPATDRLFTALRPGLDRPDVVGNRWWDELGHRSAWDVMTQRRQDRR